MRKHATAASVEGAVDMGRGSNGERCVNCGSAVLDAYCARCGQRIHRSRFTLRHLARQAVDEAFKLDHGFLRTVRALSVRPGEVVAEFVDGRTRPYTNPLKYLLLCVAVTTLVYLLSGLPEAFAPEGDPEGPAEQVAVRTADFIHRYFNIMLLAGLPFLALFSRLFFLKSGRNIAEHLIFNCYVYAQQNLLFLLIIPALFFTEPGTMFGLYYPLVVLYYGWACKQFFGTGTVSAMLRGLGITLAAYLVSLWLLVGAVVLLT